MRSDGGFHRRPWGTHHASDHVIGIRIAMKAGYPQAIKTANESGRIKF
jgi:hypothetical protein